jgi:hypothetical protein
MGYPQQAPGNTTVIVQPSQPQVVVAGGGGYGGYGRGGYSGGDLALGKYNFFYILIFSPLYDVFFFE